MGQPTMAGPAVTIGHIDPGYRFGMTPFTIAPDDFRPPVGQTDDVRDPAGIKGEDILHSGKAFPGQMINNLVIRQVAVYTFDPAVGPLMSPGFIFCFHDMAPGAELRSS
jgi:hypothetical protein